MTDDFLILNDGFWPVLAGWRSALPDPQLPFAFLESSRSDYAKQRTVHYLVE
jgi:hypothetical protein